MALSIDINKNADAKIEVVCRYEENLAMTKEDYQDYLKGGANPELLTLNDGKTLADCTLFVLKRQLDWAGHERLMKKQFEIDLVTGQPKPNPAFVMSDVQNSLVDIINPVDAVNKIEYKKDSNGLASRELLARLHNAEILMDLFSARNSEAKNANFIEKKN